MGKDINTINVDLIKLTTDNLKVIETFYRQKKLKLEHLKTTILRRETTAEKFFQKSQRRKNNYANQRAGKN